MIQKIKNIFVHKSSCLDDNFSIGENALISSDTVVTKDVPPFFLIIGKPGKIIGKVDK